MSREWEALLQGYRMEGVECTFPSTEDLLKPPTDQITLHDQCKLISALSNFHCWEVMEEKSTVGFSRMLSTRDPTGKYKPASPRNKILLALRENNYADVRAVFQKFLNYNNADFHESQLPMTTNLTEPVQGPSKRRGRQIRRLTIADILQNIGHLNPSFTTENQAQGQESYETFKITLVESGEIFWQQHSEELDIVCMNDFDIYSGNILPNKFIHLQCIIVENTIEYRCSCQLYSTLMQLATSNTPEVDFDTNLQVQCCHIHFFKEHMENWRENRSVEIENLSKIEEKIYTSIQEPKSVQEIARKAKLGTKKFSVVSENTHGFVNLTSGFIICQSGECQAVYKHCRRKAIHLNEAPDDSICPHLQIMKCCDTLWDHGDELADDDDEDEREILAENQGVGEEENSTLILQADDDLPKVWLNANICVL